ncbi:hypothetical protein AB0C70_20980 [Streptomyces sp. NPDC048564]|uniref:hypothetical protein n=1 Tax=Streptomyces sp. NPDC048564 TaxID=3155760 RepID=UPI0034410811
MSTSTANAVATWGAPADKAHAAPHAAPQAAPQAAPEAAPQVAPEAAPKAAAPEYGYGEYSAPYAAQ